MLGRIATYLSFVRFSHRCSRCRSRSPRRCSRHATRRHLRQVSLIVLCITAARTAAMAFNRLVDARIDARTRDGVRVKSRSDGISRGWKAPLFVAVMSAAFIASVSPAELAVSRSSHPSPPC